MHILALLRQNWDPRLSDNKVPFEEVSYLRKLRSVEDTTWTTDSVELFMKSYDDDAPDPDADAVILVSKGTSADELRIADLRPGRAWLDDSSDEVCAEEPYEVHSNPQSSQHAPINSLHSRIYRYRQYKGYHTAFELWQHLCTKVKKLLLNCCPRYFPESERSTGSHIVDRNEQRLRDEHDYNYARDNSRLRVARIWGYLPCRFKTRIIVTLGIFYG